MVRRTPICSNLRKIIIEDNSNGLSAYAIANKLNLSRSTIQTIITNLKKPNTIQNKRKTGRPHLTTTAESRVLKRIIKKNCRATTREIMSEWNLAIKKNVSPDTCKRTLKRLGYKFYKVCVISMTFDSLSLFYMFFVRCILNNLGKRKTTADCCTKKKES